ncbi:MAG: CinA family nicotinamide mononucleotide deamidase-related protein [Anaerolineae bacterium]|nr:CinA family nicotinamide mononucleotide deamidase-related protein [Anaerolineae bacterium]
MRAEIISIGEELLSGDSEIVDTNSIHITKLLHAIGVRVLYKTTVGDNEERIVEVILNALSRADVIITTGGLGPTVDDMTRQGVAAAVGRPLELRDDLLQEVAEKFAKFGTRMSENNKIQAMIPADGKPIHNPVGTAPGFIVEYAGRAIFSVPGVPREMRYLMEHTVIPFLKEKIGEQGIIKTRVLRTAGIGESMLDEHVGEFEKLTNPTVGLAAHTGQVDIRIYARAATEAEADALIADVEEKIRARVGSYIFGTDKDPMDAAFAQALRESGVKAVIAETGTAGLLRSQIEPYLNGEPLLQVVPESDIELLKAQNSNPDYREVALGVAKTLWEQNKPNIVITVLSDTAGSAIAITNGSETRSRVYAFGGADMSSGSSAVGLPAEWTTRWGMSMAWWLLKNIKADGKS